MACSVGMAAAQMRVDDQWSTLSLCDRSALQSLSPLASIIGLEHIKRDPCKVLSLMLVITAACMLGVHAHGRF